MGKGTESTFPTPIEWSSDTGALFSPLPAVAERAAGTVESSQAGSVLESGKMSACADIELFSLQKCDQAVVNFLAATQLES
jgi:hypothetical protein